MPDLLETIKCVADANSSTARDALHSHCARILQKPIPPEEFAAALETLASLQQIKFLSSDRIIRSEPDFSEHALESPIEKLLSGKWAEQNINISLDRTVFRRTARGGKRDTGLFSRPDFTAATIRQMKYDPLSHLDVLTFELKNREGATLMAVHEALAHTRFGHYSFLVCPRSSLRTTDNDQLRDGCSQHGIGLILFDIDSINIDNAINNSKLELPPLRRNPDPFEVEKFLEERLDDEDLIKLKCIAHNL